ncbi:MAG TPA: CDP-alcohol phosphatidyltransferase family protein [Jatrophihabitantaceae bacterium]|jgi:phosphatidylglycerophosphate synthase|nr:CDP-alcohol phosphatidyltransferase family protein [Jatrophihabitantaceae bacterium]
MHAADWSELHHGINPDRVPLLRGWLRLVWLIARPLWFVPPIVLTVLGALFAIDALLLASTQPWVALGLVLLSTLCDALDGAVAVVARKASRRGAIADKIADRIADTAFALVLWRCGAPWQLAAIAAGMSLLHEGLREIRGGALRARITVAERPTRVACTALACICAGVSTAAWPPTVCGGVWVAAAAVGLAQLARA